MTDMAKIWAVCSPSELARRLNVSRQVVSNWKSRGEIPGRRVLAVEAATGIPRHEINPDYYPPPEGVQ